MIIIKYMQNTDPRNFLLRIILRIIFELITSGTNRKADVIVLN